MFEVFDKNNQRIPLKIWMSGIDDLESEALNQALNLTRLPFAYHHIALMPDTHQGYGMPIGGVMAADGAVIPYAVGLDIGCGMNAVKTSRKSSGLRDAELNLILKQVARAIPQSFDWHKKPQSHEVLDALPREIGVIAAEEKNIRRQLGTLGGGNHFIEFQRDAEDNLWIMVHSGSRNIGKKVAEHFHKRAVRSCQTRGEILPTKELSFFTIDSPDGKEYLKAMNWCLNFARASRSRMMDAVLDIIGETPRAGIDIHHNYAALEEHFGRKVVLHRKGATKAEEGLVGIVPGSMGTKSYIVEGLGNPDSFNSCSHGAGRRLGRRQAKRSIPVEKVLREMEEKNIKLYSAALRDLPEESDHAYKDIDAVMENQRDLVKVMEVLYPIAVVKG